MPEASRAVSAVKNWANNNNNIQVNLKKGKSAFLRFCKNPKDITTNSINGVLFQPEYKYLGFNFTNSLDCQKHLQEIASSLAWVKAKSKLKMAKVSLTDKVKLWNTYLYSKLRYRLSALHFLSKTPPKWLSIFSTKTSKHLLEFQNRQTD